jgi:hypothetical protein
MQQTLRRKKVFVEINFKQNISKLEKYSQCLSYGIIVNVSALTNKNGGDLNNGFNNCTT